MHEDISGGFMKTCLLHASYQVNRGLPGMHAVKGRNVFLYNTSYNSSQQQVRQNLCPACNQRIQDKGAYQEKEHSQVGGQASQTTHDIDATEKNNLA